MKKEGISLIALIITIIIIILLAVIVFLSSSETVGRASLAKFKSEMADYKTAAQLAISEKNIELARKNVFFEQGPIAYMISIGKEIDGVIKVVQTGIIDEFEKRVFPENLEGTEYYEVVTSDTSIDYAFKDSYSAELGDVKYYITDFGETFILPGFPEYGEKGKIVRYWVNENKYYLKNDIVDTPVEPEIPPESGDIEEPDIPVKPDIPEEPEAPKPPESMEDITDEELEDFKDQFEEETGESSEGLSGWLRFLKWLFELLGWA